MRVLVADGADALLRQRDNTTPLMAAAGVGFLAEERSLYRRRGVRRRQLVWNWAAMRPSTTTATPPCTAPPSEA